MAQTKAQLVVGLNVNASAPASALQIDASGNINLDSNTLYVDATNNRVGIGTSSPADALHVVGKIAVTGTNPSIRQTVQTANLDLCGGTTVGTDSSIQIYGSTNATDANIIYYNGNTHIWRNAAGNTERVRIDSSGRLGIGTTSPTDTNGFGNCIDIRSSTGAAIYLRDSDDTTNDTFVIGRDNSDSYLISNSGNILFSNNGSERARIDSSGRLLVGTSTDATARLVVKGSAGSGDDGINVISGSTTVGSKAAIFFSPSTSGSFSTGSAIKAERLSPDGSDLQFYTCTALGNAPTERGRFTSTGYFKASNNGSYTTFGTDMHELRTTASQWTTSIRNVHASDPYGLYITYSASPNNTTNPFVHCATDTGGTFAQIRSNGGLANVQANNVNLSDERTKKDISPASDTWNCIKEWEIVNYRYRNQPDDADLNLGVIAQQVAESCPEVITVFQEAKEATEDQPAQEERLGVKEQQMYWMAIKALQEAQVRIEALEAEVAALKAQ